MFDPIEKLSFKEKMAKMIIVWGLIFGSLFCLKSLFKKTILYEPVSIKPLDELKRGDKVMIEGKVVEIIGVLNLNYSRRFEINYK